MEAAFSQVENEFGIHRRGPSRRVRGLGRRRRACAGKGRGRARPGKWEGTSVAGDADARREGKISNKTIAVYFQTGVLQSPKRGVSPASYNTVDHRRVPSRTTNLARLYSPPSSPPSASPHILPPPPCRPLLAHPRPSLAHPRRQPPPPPPRPTTRPFPVSTSSSQVGAVATSADHVAYSPQRTSSVVHYRTRARSRPSSLFPRRYVPRSLTSAGPELTPRAHRPLRPLVSTRTRSREASGPPPSSPDGPTHALPERTRHRRIPRTPRARVLQRAAIPADPRPRLPPRRRSFLRHMSLPLLRGVGLRPPSPARLTRHTTSPPCPTQALAAFSAPQTRWSPP